MNKVKSLSVSSEDSSPKLPEVEQRLHESKNSIDRDEEMVPPDGGWGWMIVGGSILIMSLGSFPLYSFSILFSPILISSGASSTKTAWIFNLNFALLSCYALFIGPLNEQFGFRKMAIFGGLATFLSLFLSAFVPTSDYLFITFALPGGIATSSGVNLSFIVVSRYFKKHRGLAIGITSMGGCLSSFMSPIIANYLLENYGYISAAVISGALCLNQLVGASLYQPVKWHMKPSKTFMVAEKNSKDLIKFNQTEENDLHKEDHIKEQFKKSHSSTKSKNNSYGDKVIMTNQNKTNILIKVLQLVFKSLKLVKYMRVHFIAWSFSGLMFGFSNFQMWIPFVITSKGYSLEVAAWCSSLSVFGNVIGRILMSLLADRKFFNVKYGFMFGQILFGSSMIAFCLVNDIDQMIIAISFFGFGAGICISSYITVMIEVMGVKKLPALIGIYSILKCLVSLTFGPLIGMVRDSTQSYKIALMIFAGFQFLGFLMLLLLPLGEKFDNWNEQRLERKKETKTDASPPDISIEMIEETLLNKRTKGY